MADPDDLPIFRPRIGAGRRPASANGGASFRNAVLSLGGRRRSGQRAAPPSRVAVHPAGAASRRVVVKAHLVKMTASGAKAAALHLRYIERDGVEKDGSKGVLYDERGAARADSFEQPRPGEKHQFRFIVSPEDASELDLTAYVRALMARVERDLGRKLEWAAVNHHDTDHPHAHIVLRGVDRDGRELRLDRGYISNGLRWSAQELATAELGPRPEHAIERARAREVTQDRFTSLDRDIERRATREGHVDLSADPRRPREDRTVLVARLEQLERLQLARRLAPSSWSLEPGWQPHLRALGARGDVLKQIHAAIAGDPARYAILRPGQPLPSTDGKAPVVSGRVAAKGLSDELKGTFYAVVETPDGRAVHVPLDRRAAEELRPGDIVSLTTRPETPVRPVDRRLDAAARTSGGVVDLARDAATDAARQTIERRLRELERAGLATRQSPTTWSLPLDLLERLKRAPEAEPPRHRLLLHREPLPIARQIQHPGPVWLDRIASPGACAPYGLGADVQRALAQRREVLRGLGIDPADPARIAKLRELERLAVGKDIAARSGQTFVARPPKGFRGRVELAPPGTPAAGYAVVSDGARFAVVRAKASLRAAAGQTIDLAQEPTGRTARIRPSVRRDRER
jgi:type IV secretory pathway VirD2 relaxase